MVKQGDGARGDAVPGNTIMSQAAFDNFVYKVGKGWLETLRMLGNLADRGVHVSALRIKWEAGTGTPLLIVIKAETEDGGVVAFHGSDSSETAWGDLAGRLRAGRLKWKEDEYYEPR